MSILIVLTVLSLAGVGAALWLVKNDPESDETPPLKNARPKPKAEAPPEPDLKASVKKKGGLGALLNKIKPKKKDAPLPKSEDEPPAEKPKKSSGPLSGMLAKIGVGSLLMKLKLGKKEPEKREDKETEPLRLHEMPKEDNEKEAPSKGKPEAVKASHENKADNPLSELQEKYQKLDELFKEKSAELAKAKESLDNELKHRQEFTKIQAILEGEIKEYKEKLNQAQAEDKEPNAQIEEYKEEIAALQKRVAGLVKDLVESEKEANALNKQSVLSEFEKQEEPPVQKPPEGEEPKTIPIVEPSDEQAPADETTQLIRSLGSQAPPEPYKEPSEDASPKEEASPAVPEEKEPPETPEEEPEDKAEDLPQMRLMKEPSDEDEEASKDDSTQASGTLGPQPPPESEEEPEKDDDGDSPEKEESFLKLQPDITSEEPEAPETPQEPEEKPQEPEEKPQTSEKSSSIADEIENSIQSTMNPDASSEPKKENNNENTEDTKE